MVTFKVVDVSWLYAIAPECERVVRVSAQRHSTPTLAPRCLINSLLTSLTAEFEGFELSKVISNPCPPAPRYMRKVFVMQAKYGTLVNIVPDGHGEQNHNVTETRHI